ncbi:unnamed protein product [Nippostrongylus brasiliensis]|uniref:Uncharacterized protein n=1 Tax=Nippostrongylus brasiliensis TaxID=27835 RepID=A0A0N4Y1M5_NIPBR|nr:unnamed protein product [Nippostrongylus brasiliensis]
MSIFLNGSLLSSPEKSQFSSAATLSSSPDPTTNFSTQSAFNKTRAGSEDQSEKKSAYSISNILDKKENSPTASSAFSSSTASDDDTGSPRCGSTEEEHGEQIFLLYFAYELLTRKMIHPCTIVSGLQAYLSFLVGQQLNSAAVAAANPLRILAQDQGILALNENISPHMCVHAL